MPSAVTALTTRSRRSIEYGFNMLAGPLNELRSIVTGWYCLPRETER